MELVGRSSIISRGTQQGFETSFSIQRLFAGQGT